MKKVLITSLCVMFSFSFASEVSQAADQQAMQDCLKTKTQAECNLANKAAKKAATDAKNKETTGQ
ncbi:hypothetical protein [Aquella oligotrophica]|uniref:Secreted protein n=1 Tax=Aquella oligotrophica TaxID=2067065 RepID=A0A2I7N5L9_9NEIS|nr:hypothetical protein [Aquella oligotrophica]AUR51763.1 hypothetical protein CUN60_05465 [Aquella oligotrophica]